MLPDNMKRVEQAGGGTESGTEVGPVAGARFMTSLPGASVNE